jgi:hypothetical protein
LGHSFIGLEFATWKFPVAFVNFAQGSGGQQELLLVIDQDANGHVHSFAVYATFTLQMGVCHQQGWA